MAGYLVDDASRRARSRPTWTPSPRVARPVRRGPKGMMCQPDGTLNQVNKHLASSARGSHVTATQQGAFRDACLKVPDSWTDVDIRGPQQGLIREGGPEALGGVMEARAAWVGSGRPVLVRLA